MKKLILGLSLLCVSIAAQAQFEQGKWVINPSVTGLNLSHSSAEDTRFGLGAQAGAFIIDNAALMVSVGADWTDARDTYYTGAGGRYYFDAIGVYVGAGLKMNHWKPKYSGSVTDFATYAEGGYAFFITKTITIEPALYYDLSLKDSDYSKFGLKVGFALYF